MSELQTSVKGFLENMLTLMGQSSATVTIDITEEEGNPVVNANINGEGVDLLIGYHGKNLAAIHTVTLAFIKRTFDKMGENKRVMLNLDIGEYFSKQTDKVIKQVQEAIEDVRLLQEPYEFTPMSPRMRRVVHLEIEKYTDVRSESTGEGESRRVVIHPKNVEA